MRRPAPDAVETLTEAAPCGSHPRTRRPSAPEASLWPATGAAAPLP